MANAVPGAGVIGLINKKKAGKIVRLFLFFLGVAIIAFAGYLVWRHFSKNNKTSVTPTIVLPSAVEQKAKESTDKFLMQGDTESYQITQRILAQQYLANNDPHNAERIMNEIFTKVSLNKIDSGTYYVMVGVEKTKGDQAQYKHYLQLLIDRLKTDGNTSAVADEQKILDGLR